MRFLTHILDSLDDIIARVYLALIVCGLALVIGFISDNAGSWILTSAWFALLVVSVVASLSCLFSFRRVGFYVFVPLAINAVSLLLPDVGSRVNQTCLQGQREQVVQRVCQDTTYQSTDYRRLESPDSRLSETSIDVEVHAGKKYIMFYTYVPALMLSSEYAGYLYVQTGGDAREFRALSDQTRARISQIDQNWFSVHYR